MRTLDNVKAIANEMSTYNDGMIIVFWNYNENKGKIVYDLFCTEEKNNKLRSIGFLPISCFIDGDEYPIVDIQF